MGIPVTRSWKSELADRLMPVARQLFQRMRPAGLRRLLWYSFIAPRFYWRGWCGTIPTSDGWLFPVDTENLIPRFIFWFGCWEPQISAFVRRRLKTGDVFVDIGCNLGWYSLLASKLVGTRGSVVAIDASKEFLNRLEATLKMNDIQNVLLFRNAVWKCEDRLQLYIGPEENLGLTTVEAEFATTEHRMEAELVPALPLGRIVPAGLLDQVRLVKIDAEGSEWEVVQGLTDLLGSMRRDVEFLVEVSPETLHRKGVTVEDLLQPFLQEGFHIYQVPNEYRQTFYLDYCVEHEAKPPRRIRQLPTLQADLVLSRVDQEVL